MKVRIRKEQLRESFKPPHKPLPSYRVTGVQPEVHSYMRYRCGACKREWLMFLEIGVEDCGEHGREPQPSPFVITCECGGFAQDISGTIHLPEHLQLPPRLPFFAYDNSGKEMACGIKSVYVPKTEVNNGDSRNEPT